MTVSTVSNFVVYTGDNVAVTFSFTFPVYAATHLRVYTQDLTTRVLTLVSNADYSVTGIGLEAGGSVVMDTAVTSANRLVIARFVPLTQDLDVLNQGGFYPENIENEFDLLQMQLQQHDEQISRTVRGQITDAWPELPAPAERAGKLLGFANDATAHPTVDSENLLFTLLSSVLQAGSGISITVGAGVITITNSDPGGALQESWLLEDASGGGGGGGADPEVIRDIIGTALQGLGCVIVVDDGANTITVDCTQAVTAEIIRDTMGTALVAGSGILIAVNDGANTITISSDSSGVGEIARDALGTALIGGIGITVTVNDGADTITIDSIPEILTVVSAATVTPTFAYDQVNITAQAAGLAVADPTGTAVDGHGILIRIKDNGTSRAITWGAKYRTFNDVLPAATTISKTHYVGVVYNAADDKWDVLGVRAQA